MVSRPGIGFIKLFFFFLLFLVFWKTRYIGLPPFFFFCRERLGLDNNSGGDPHPPAAPFRYEGGGRHPDDNPLPSIYIYKKAIRMELLGSIRVCPWLAPPLLFFCFVIGTGWPSV